MSGRSFWTAEEWMVWPSRKRARTINSLSGFKSANVIGTSDAQGVHNLSVVSSVVHLGSSPAQMGVVLRPPGADAHTYKNIMATGQCTFNHVGEAWFQQAHQCSARYPADVSEFEETGLTPAFPTQVGPGWQAPAVGEASVRMGLTLLKDFELPNACRFIVMQVEWADVPSDVVRGDGYVDLEAADTVAISGLDGYHTTQSLGRWSYAKTDREVSVLDDPARGWEDVSS